MADQLHNGLASFVTCRVTLQHLSTSLQRVSAVPAARVCASPDSALNKSSCVSLSRGSVPPVHGIQERLKGWIRIFACSVWPDKCSRAHSGKPLASGELHPCTAALRRRVARHVSKSDTLSIRMENHLPASERFAATCRYQRYKPMLRSRALTVWST